MSLINVAYYIQIVVSIVVLPLEIFFPSPLVASLLKGGAFPGKSESSGFLFYFLIYIVNIFLLILGIEEGRESCFLQAWYRGEQAYNLGMYPDQKLNQ